MALGLGLAADGALVTLAFALRHGLLWRHRARRLALRAALRAAVLWQVDGPCQAKAAARPRPL